jgi:hypothetical protein
VPCRALFTRDLPLGRSVWDQERGNLPLEGEEVLHTPKFPSPINRDPSPHFKTQKRRALKKRSVATIVRKKFKTHKRRALKKRSVATIVRK